MEGWIKLHRKMLEWRWASSPKHLSLFVHLLMRANHKESVWRKEKIKPGQLLTGRKQLAEWSGLTERQIRTVLQDLTETGEIDQQTTNKYSIITIIKWKDYQIHDNQTTNKCQTTDQQTTTSKNINNINNINNTICKKITPDAIVDLWNREFAKEGQTYPGLGAGKHLENCLEAMKYLDTIEKWKDLFAKATSNEFLSKGTDNWKVNLTWLVDYDNALKVIGGNYTNTNSAEIVIKDFLKRMEK